MLILYICGTTYSAKMIKFITLCSLFVATLGLNINFKDCGSKGAKINSIDLSPCDSDPCVLHAGTNYTAHVNFTASENTNTGKTVVHGIIAGIPVPFPVPSPDACQGGMTCPVQSGTTQIYMNSLFCSPDYPKIKLLAKWEVVDDKDQDLFCFIVPLTIQ